MVVFYDVGDDPAEMWNVLTTPPFRSAEWWTAVREERAGVERLSGVISDVYWSGFGDFPEFKLSGSTETTSWKRHGDISRYAVGLCAQVEFVWVRWKRPIPRLDRDGSTKDTRDERHRVVVRVLVEDSDLRSDPTPWSDKRRRGRPREE